MKRDLGIFQRIVGRPRPCRRMEFGELCMMSEDRLRDPVDGVVGGRSARGQLNGHHQRPEFLRLVLEVVRLDQKLREFVGQQRLDRLNLVGRQDKGRDNLVGEQLGR